MKIFPFCLLLLRKSALPLAHPTAALRAAGNFFGLNGLGMGGLFFILITL
jgi:hypothetical protein